MSATASPAPPLAPAQPRAPAPPLAPAALERHDLRRRVITVLVLAVCAGTVLLAVPDLRPVVREIAAMNPGLVAVAVVLELASCASFVVIFRRFFSPVPGAVAREMAWSQMGSGALLPGGGVGALAAGGWLLHLAGMPTREIVRRSSGLFFLTSAINVIVLGAGGVFLLLGIGGGPHDLLRAGVPAVAGVGAIVLALGLPKLTRRLSARGRRAAWLDDIGAGVPAARDALLRPNWRLLGALGYLLFDIAVLWTTLAAVGPCRRWRRSWSPISRAISSTCCRSPAASASLTPDWSVRSCSTGCRCRTPRLRCSSTTRWHSGFPRLAACSPTAGCVRGWPAGAQQLD